MEFTPFPKIARLRRECMITEKIDGTNAQVFIRELADDEVIPTDTPLVAVVGTSLIYAGSRSRWIIPGDDNMGFALWVKEHAEDLSSLGPGPHFGEWWGLGIQRRYGQTEKKFSLFNAWRWNDNNPNRPKCCGVVPLLYSGPFSTDTASTQIERLRTLGSVAAPGFMKPEGIVIYLSAAKAYFKQTLEKDEESKGQQQEAA